MGKTCTERTKLAKANEIVEDEQNFSCAKMLLRKKRTMKEWFKSFLLDQRFYWTNNFTKQSFSKKTNKIDGTWTIILRKIEINFLTNRKNTNKMGPSQTMDDEITKKSIRPSHINIVQSTSIFHDNNNILFCVLFYPHYWSVLCCHAFFLKCVWKVILLVKQLETIIRGTRMKITPPSSGNVNIPLKFEEHK